MRKKNLTHFYARKLLCTSKFIPVQLRNLEKVLMILSENYRFWFQCNNIQAHNLYILAVTYDLPI